MVRKLLSGMMVIGLCCSVAMAEETEKKAGPSISQWLKGLQVKIAQISPKKAPPQGTIVAGVRGAKGDASSKLYWKGKKGEEPVSEEEMAEFKQGVDLALKGDKPAAIKELSEFMKQYPDSALIPDAKKTLDLVKSDLKDEPKAEAKPEVKPEVKAEPAPAKPEVKPEEKPEAKADVKAEPKAEAKPEAKPAAKTKKKAAPAQQ